MKAKIFDRRFDAGESVMDRLDLGKVRRVGTDPKRLADRSERAVSAEKRQ
jgi:hypothetical protein